MDKKLLRAIDANYNRAKEGLRVVEDIFRFILEDNSLRLAARKIRHGLTPASCEIRLHHQAVRMRNAAGDAGKNTDNLELKRKNIQSVLSANLARVKESLRVLEELFKLADGDRVAKIKKMRYRVYELEKKINIKHYHYNEKQK